MLHLEQIIDLLLDDLDLPGQIHIPDLKDLYDLYDLAHVAGWDLQNLHDLLVAHVSWVGSVLHTDLAQDIIMAG